MISKNVPYWKPPAVKYCQSKNTSEPAQDIYLEVVDGLEEMLQLKKEWKHLILDSSATIFQSFEWLYHWWQYFGKYDSEHHLFILILREEGHIIGIAPFFIQSYSLRNVRIFSQLKVMGSGLSKSISPVSILDQWGPGNYSDIIVKNGSEKKVSTALASCLEHRSHLWDEIVFHNVSEEGDLHNYLLPALEEKNFEVQKKKTTNCRINEHGKRTQIIPDQYFSNCSFRNPDFEEIDIKSDKDIDRVVQILSHLHQDRCTSSGIPGLFADKRFKVFLREVTKEFARENMLWLKFLRYRDTNAAVYMAFKIGNEIYPYLYEYDRELFGQIPDSMELKTKISQPFTSSRDCLVTNGCFKVDDRNNKGLRGYPKWHVKVSAGRNTSMGQKPKAPGSDYLYHLFKLSERVIYRLKNELSVLRLIASEKGVLSRYGKLLLTRLKRRTQTVGRSIGYDKQESSDQSDNKKKADKGKYGELKKDIIQQEGIAKYLNKSKFKFTDYGDFTIDYLEDLQDVVRISREWNELETRFRTPLMSEDWYISSVETFCPPNALKMVEVRRDTELSAIAPLSIKGRYLPRMEFVGSSTLMEAGGVLYKDEHSLAALIDSLLEMKMPLCLKGLRLFSPEVEILESKLKKSSSILFVKGQRLPSVKIQTSWDKFEKHQISSSRRSSFRRFQRKAEKRGKTQFEVVVPTPENLQKYLDEVYRVEAANWKGEGGTAIKTHSALRTFFNCFAKRMAQKNNLYLFFLQVDGKNIATQFTVFRDNRLWILKIGHDEEWSRCSPGVLLMNNVVRWCFENDLESCEFLGSDESWLHIWANKFHSLITYEIYPKSVKGILVLFWRHIFIDGYHKIKARLNR